MSVAIAFVDRVVKGGILDGQPGYVGLVIDAPDYGIPRQAMTITLVEFERLYDSVVRAKAFLDARQGEDPR